MGRKMVVGDDPSLLQAVVKPQGQVLSYAGAPGCGWSFVLGIFSILFLSDDTDHILLLLILVQEIKGSEREDEDENGALKSTTL